MQSDQVGKWAAGASCECPTLWKRDCILSDRWVVDGPVLSQTDLYLLGTELQINPILQHEGDTDFHLVFNLMTGA